MYLLTSEKHEIEPIPYITSQTTESSSALTFSHVNDKG